MLLNYTVSEAISTLISIFPAIFGVLAGVGLITLRKNQKAGNIIFTVIMAVLAIAAILLYHNGILSKQDVDAYSEHTYFGQTKNNKPDGFGRLFDGDDRIYYCGDFKSGRITGEGKYYDYDEESKTTYVKYEGSFDKGWNEGHVIHREIIAGMEKPVFDADYKHGSRYGQGREYRYYDDGTLQYTYECCFVHDIYWGYGVRTDYDKDGNITLRYSGTYTDGAMSGPAVYEFTSDGAHYVYVGNMGEGRFNGEGAMYDESAAPMTSGIYKDGQISEKQDLFEKYPCPEKLFWK